jgi:epoxyqueuosine reductase
VPGQLLAELAARDIQARIVPAQHVQDLQDEIETRHHRGQFHDEFYETRLTWFRFVPPEALPDTRSIIVIAVPRPQTEAVFHLRGRSLSLTIPPTYTGYGKVAQRVEDLLAGVLALRGYRVERTALPLKLLAVHSGLGAYGRNNICYVPGMGSFLQFVGLYSDLPCAEDTWRELRMMAACETCRACLHHCPTGAISEDRFLLHAERCIVYHNEKPAGIPFPAWIDPSWHNCLEGCMHCQRACPEDRDFLGWTEGTEEFSEEETALLLAGVPEEDLPQETIGKLERLDILGDLALLPRNLGAFLRT